MSLSAINVLLSKAVGNSCVKMQSSVRRKCIKNGFFNNFYRFSSPQNVSPIENVPFVL